MSVDKFKLPPFSSLIKESWRLLQSVYPQTISKMAIAFLPMPLFFLLSNGQVSEFLAGQSLVFCLLALLMTVLSIPISRAWLQVHMVSSFQKQYDPTVNNERSICSSTASIILLWIQTCLLCLGLILSLLLLINLFVSGLIQIATFSYMIIQYSLGRPDLALFNPELLGSSSGFFSSYVLIYFVAFLVAYPISVCLSLAWWSCAPSLLLMQSLTTTQALSLSYRLSKGFIMPLIGKTLLVGIIGCALSPIFPLERISFPILSTCLLFSAFYNFFWAPFSHAYFFTLSHHLSKRAPSASKKKNWTKNIVMFFIICGAISLFISCMTHFMCQQGISS